MKAKVQMLIVALSVFSALTLPVQLYAQHARYKFVDIGTLGGPFAYGPGNGAGSQLLNNAGIVAGTADTSTPDPSAPNCANPDCFVSHAFRWQQVALTDLVVLPWPPAYVAAQRTNGLITFVQITPEGPANVFIANPDGSNAQQVPLPPDDPAETFGVPIWSPDGSKLLISHT
jgi:hypothetical protein